MRLGLRYFQMYFMLSLSITLHAQITIESGVELTITDGAIITAEGDVNNAGTISGKGTLTIAGNYTNTGTLAVVIGPDQFTHTTIDVTGDFIPDGNFTVTTDSYVPTNGDQATIITSGSSIVGNFSNSNDNNWFANYNLPNSGDFTISHSVALPVELLSFTSDLSKSGVLLKWQTVSEINNEGFEIQRSSDAANWTKIGFKEGKKYSVELNKYEFNDEKPLLGINYYRLKQIDFDGTYEYHKILAVDIKNLVTVNPTLANQEVNVNFRGEATISIINPAGQLLRQIKATDSTTVDISELKSGNYFLSIKMGHQAAIARFIKQ